MTEKQLIKRCRQHDRVAQQKLYEKYAPVMLSICMRYVKDYHVACDLMHDGFITVYSKIGDFRSEGSFEGWMRRIFVNTALEALRKNDLLRNGVELDALEPQQEADYSAVEKISADELMELIAQLPPGFRTVFNMFAIEGYSHREIAETLNINESTSRSQYTRAKRLLQKWIKELK